MVDPVLFSSESTEWETPPKLFNHFDKLFHFTLDVCATPRNTKCPKFFDLAQNSLEQSWAGESCWMNPPYGRGLTDAWVAKAVKESRHADTQVVCLLPARTDTSWWHEYVIPFAWNICFIRGRLRFVGAPYSAPFPSVVVVFGNCISYTVSSSTQAMPLAPWTEGYAYGIYTLSAKELK